MEKNVVHTWASNEYSFKKPSIVTYFGSNEISFVGSFLSQMKVKIPKVSLSCATFDKITSFRKFTSVTAKELGFNFESCYGILLS